jgi:hypothetical protein
LEFKAETITRIPQLLAANVSCPVFRVDFTDFLYTVDIRLIHFIRVAAAQSAGRTVFTAVSTEIKRPSDDFFPLFPCGILDQYAAHWACLLLNDFNRLKQQASAGRFLFDFLAFIIPRSRFRQYHSHSARHP